MSTKSDMKVWVVLRGGVISLALNKLGVKYFKGEKQMTKLFKFFKKVSNVSFL
jgi:hypothetical protein